MRTEGKIGLLVGFQSSDHFRVAADVDAFHALGQRVSQLTYNARGRIGCGCFEARDTGLTPYGAEIVAAMNRVGMVVDVSHCSERTCLDAFAVSRQPALITHSNCRKISANPRCKSDTVIRAMAERGGVMGITSVAAFVRGRPPATIEDVLDHFDHVVRLTGVEHVGIGSDLAHDAVDPRTGQALARYAVRGLPPARRIFDLTEGLIRRGYDDRAIELILGGNFQRVLDHDLGPRARRGAAGGGGGVDVAKASWVITEGSVASAKASGINAEGSGVNAEGSAAAAEGSVVLAEASWITAEGSAAVTEGFVGAAEQIRAVRRPTARSPPRTTPALPPPGPAGGCGRGAPGRSATPQRRGWWRSAWLALLWRAPFQHPGAKTR